MLIKKAEKWPPKNGEWFSILYNGFGVMIWIGCPECGRLMCLMNVNGEVSCERCNWKEKVTLEGWNNAKGGMR